MYTVTRIVIVAAIATALSVVGATGHEGHDDGPAPRIVANAAPRTEAVSDTLELVAVARGTTLTIHLDRFRSNEPVPKATLTIETPAGSVTATPAGDGIYSAPAPWAARAGKFDLIFTVVENGTADILPATLVIGEQVTQAASSAEATLRNVTVYAIAGVGGIAVIVVLIAVGWGRRRAALVAAIVPFAFVLATIAVAHEGDNHGQAVPAPTERDLAQRDADGSLFVPKPIQRILGIRTEMVATSTYRHTIELPGRIIPDPNASGLVQASAGGRLSPPDSGFPRLGTRVNKGDVLAYVTPPIQTIDRSDMRQRQGELDQQISIVERRIVRFESLVGVGGVTQVQLDEARLELAGLKDRRAALDRARGEPEALVAPVSGVVADVNAVAGQMAQPSTILFQIIEPARLWVEALSFDVLTNAQRATVKLGGGRSLPITYEGSGLADRNQAVPVHFRLEGDTSGIRVGQFVTVLATTEEEHHGIAVPKASVVRTQAGQDVVFEHTSAERFEPRSVRVEPLDGERVLLLTGVASNTRIVTHGAELLDQIR